MAEVLKTFIEGEDILASETNSNNQFLLGRISDNAERLQNYVEGEISSMQSNIGSVQATLQNNINAAIELFGSNGAYVTTYISGNSGYREYFSDKEKTDRVFLIQWGTVVGFNTCTFQKAFQTGCSIIAIPITGETCVSAAIAWWNKSGFCPKNGTHGGHHEDRTGLTNFWIAIGK